MTKEEKERILAVEDVSLVKRLAIRMDRCHLCYPIAFNEHPARTAQVCFERGVDAMLEVMDVEDSGEIVKEAVGMVIHARAMGTFL